MNMKETVALIAAIKALCPSQKFEENTHRAWHLVLDDIPFTDAQAAIKTIYRTQGNDLQWNRTIEADAIIRQVNRDNTRHVETGPSCDICGRSEYACQLAQQNGLRIGNEVHDRHPGRPWVNHQHHQFIPRRTTPPLEVVQ